MIIAKIQVSGVHAKTVYSNFVPAGIIGAEIEISYTDDIWRELRKTVVFRGSVTKDVVTDASIVTIPPEVVETPNSALSVGVYGVDTDGSLVVPTLWADLGYIRPATDPSGDTTTAPSIPVWAQIQSMIGNLDELETTARENLVAAVNEAMTKGGGAVDEAEIRRIVDAYLAANPPAPGEQGPPGPKGDPGDPGADGKTPEYGVDYGTQEQIAEIAQSAANILQPEVNQIKDDLADKLPKSPVNWESWTSEEQAAALDRIGIGGFWGMNLPLLKTITLEEAVSSIDILSSEEGITLKEFSVFLFATAAGDDGVAFSGILCLRSNGGSQYWGYSDGYIKKSENAYKIWHTKIYDNKFAVTDILAGFSNAADDIAYGSYQGLYDATQRQISAVTSNMSCYPINNLNLFLSGATTSGAVIPHGSMIFLFGR